MKILLAIYDSTRFIDGSFWCYRHPEINPHLLDVFYSFLVKNQDIANLSEITNVQQRLGVALLDERTSVVYRIFAGQETSRLSSVVIALFFDLNTCRDIDVIAIWTHVKEIEQYITQHQRENGILSCPLRNPSQLVFEAELPCQPLSGHSQNLTAYSLQDTKLPDFRSDRFMSIAPKETLLNTLQTYARQAGELVCTAHFKNDNQAEIHALWLPTPKNESSVSDMFRSQTEISSGATKQTSMPSPLKKQIFIALTATIVLGAFLLLSILIKYFINPVGPNKPVLRPGPTVVMQPFSPRVKTANSLAQNDMTNISVCVIHSPTNCVQPFQSSSSTNGSPAIEHQE